MMLMYTRSRNRLRVKNDGTLQQSRSASSMRSSGQDQQAVTYPRLPSLQPQEGSLFAPVTDPYALVPANSARLRLLPSVTEAGSSISSTDSHFAIPPGRKKATSNTVATRPPLRIGSNNVLRDCKDSSDSIESLTQENMRKMAAQIVAMEQKIGHVYSDEVYGMKMGLLLLEERRKSIRGMVNDLDGQVQLTLASHPHLQLEARGSASGAAASTGEGLERGRTRDRASPRIIRDDYVNSERDQSIPVSIAEPMQHCWAQQDKTASSWDRTNANKEEIVSATSHAAKGLSPHGPQKSQAATSSSPQSQRRVGQEHHVKLEDVVVKDFGAQQTEADPQDVKGKGKQKAVKDEDEAGQYEDGPADKWFEGVRAWRDV
jgi:hypothetical protein